MFVFCLFVCKGVGGPRPDAIWRGVEVIVASQTMLPPP